MKIRGALSACLGMALLASSTSWAAYDLPAIRKVVWQPGVTYNGGIPDRKTVYRPDSSVPAPYSLVPSGGDDTQAIQELLDNCPADAVVYLGPGTFHIGNADPFHHGLAINTSNITLRGSGPDQTKLVQTADTLYSVIDFGSGYHWGGQTAFAEDAVKGSNHVTLVSNPGLSVGEVVHVNETYDPALTFFNPETQTSVNDYLGWGEGRIGSPSQSRPIGQAMEIASISGNVVTFTTQFHMSYRTSHSAHLARITGTENGADFLSQVRWSGIEDLAVSLGGGGDGGGNIVMFACAYCWAKNIESGPTAQGASLAFNGCFRCEVRDSYLHTALDANPGGAGYGLVFDTYSADCLAENNISWSFNKVMAMRSSGGGNVIGYNYMQDGYGATYPTIVEVGLNASHMTTPQHELLEGNESFNFDSDTYWGNSIYITIFRNSLTGLRTSAGGLQLSDQYERHCAGLGQYDWDFSFVGNVLGFAGMKLNEPMPGGPTGETAWVYEGGGAYDGTANIWEFVDMDLNLLPPTDPTLVSMIRHGNYDYMTNAIDWNGTDDRTLPASLYIPSGQRPAFFGSLPWPWVTPENAPNTTATLPAKVRFNQIQGIGPDPTPPARPRALRVR